MKKLLLIFISLFYFFYGYSQPSQSLLTENQFSFGVGFSRDYNNAWFPRFKRSPMPEEYAENWTDDQLVEGRVLFFSWYFELNDKIPLKVEYFRGEFQEQYSDPLMLFAESKFDKLYNSLVIGSYTELLKKQMRHQVMIDYGLNFYRIFNSIAAYEIDVDREGVFYPKNPYVENSYENNITLNLGIQYNFFSKNNKVAIGIKASAFQQLDYHQNFSGWALSPSISYLL